MRFSTSGFFHESFPPGPPSIPLGHFEFFWKFSETFTNECLSLVSMTPVISCSPVSTTQVINLSLTPANNPCHRFSVIASVINTGNKFLNGANDTGRQLSLVTTTLAINLLQVTTMLVVRHRPGPEWGAWGNPQELNWFLPLIKPLRRTRTLCDPTQTQVWSESSVVEHNLYFARLAIAG